MPLRMGRGSLVRSFGFVLAELVIVLAILAGLAVTTFPAFSYWRARDRLQTYAQNLLATLSYARSEAIKRGGPVTVCRADENGTACRKSAQVCRANARGTLADDWGCGYAVLADSTSYEGERMQQTLRVQAPLEGVTLFSKISTPLRFTPPAGQILGGFRRFELKSRLSPESNWDERLQLCLTISAGGRAWLVNGPCPNNQ